MNLTSRWFMNEFSNMHLAQLEISKNMHKLSLAKRHSILHLMDPYQRTPTHSVYFQSSPSHHNRLQYTIGGPYRKQLCLPHSHLCRTVPDPDHDLSMNELPNQ